MHLLLEFSQLEADVESVNPDYLILYRYLENPSLQMYIDSNQLDWQINFENEEFTLYEKIEK